MSSVMALLGIELDEVSAKEKVVSAATGAVAITLLVLLARWVDADAGGAWLISSMGASAVLLFAVPHGQLSQPWPVIAGHVVSALIGVTCARYISHPALAGGAAVGLSIGAMHQFKFIHPPGGATALTAVIGGPNIRALGYGFVVHPVLVGSVAMVLFAVALNALFPWRRFPAHLARRPPHGPDEPSHRAVVAALRRMDSFIDVSEEDLVELYELVREEMSLSGP
ncbi:MAG: HPP family protein [Acidimicrobiales bacterium]